MCHSGTAEKHRREMQQRSSAIGMQQTRHDDGQRHNNVWLHGSSSLQAHREEAK